MSDKSITHQDMKPEKPSDHIKNNSCDTDIVSQELSDRYGLVTTARLSDAAIGEIDQQDVLDYFVKVPKDTNSKKQGKNA